MKRLFNALRSDELLIGIGRVLRLIAATDGPLEEYARSQTLSAYSVTRLLAAEQAAAPELLRQTRQSLQEALDPGPERPPAVARAREEIQAAPTGIEVGDALCDLLAELPRDSPVRQRVHTALAQMVDREVAALAGAPR